MFKGIVNTVSVTSNGLETNFSDASGIGNYVYTYNGPDASQVYTPVTPPVITVDYDIYCKSLIYTDTVTKYTIYKVKYKIAPLGKYKELVFAHQSDLAPELAIMQAADKRGLKFIEIIGIEELGSTEILLTPMQQVKEIEI